MDSLSLYGNTKLKVGIAAAIVAVVIIAVAVFALGLGRSPPTTSTVSLGNKSSTIPTISTTPISTPSISTTTTIAYNHVFLSNLFSITNTSAVFGANYTVASSFSAGNFTSNTVARMSIQRYFNDSRLELTVLSRSGSVSNTEVYVKKSGDYYACSINPNVSRCYQINASAVNFSATLGREIISTSSNLSFSNTSYTQALFNGHPCTLAFGTLASIAGSTIAACVSNSTGMVYNFTLDSTSSHVTGSLSAQFQPSSSSGLISLPNSTLSSQPANVTINVLAIPVFVINNFNPLYGPTLIVSLPSGTPSRLAS